jgi:hypothetical protein
VILAVGLILARSGGTNGTSVVGDPAAASLASLHAGASSATLQRATGNATTIGTTTTRDVGQVSWSHIGQRLTLSASATVAPSAVAPIPLKSGVRIARRDSISALIDSTAVSEQQEIRKRQLDGFFALVAAHDVQEYLAARAYQQALYDTQQFLTALAVQRQRQIETPPKPPAVTAPAAPATSGGSSAGGVWAALRNCESGGNYAENTGNGFYGAYQFELSTWHGMGYAGYPNDAPPAVQDAAAAALQARSGWGQWPECSRKLGLR